MPSRPYKHWRVQAKELKSSLNFQTWSEFFDLAAQVLYIVVYIVKSGKSLSVYDEATKEIKTIKIPALEKAIRRASVQITDQRDPGPQLTLVVNNEQTT